ncbi:MAG: hypothetical protein K9K62_10535 [Desulfobacteraceae bacterium]|nr:hypothetical protein [Desulfobacteraceae bacterium]
MKKLLIALLVLGLIAPGMAMAQNLDQRVTELENNMEDFAKQGMKLKETVIDMKKMGFHFYSSLRVNAAYYDVDKEYVANIPEHDNTIGTYLTDDDSGLSLGLSDQSRFGAKAIVSENFYGVAELGLRTNTRDGKQDNTYLRLLYGVWDFGNGKLTVGQDYTPGTFLGYSGQMGDIGSGGGAVLLNAGFPYIDRQAQMKLSFGDFDIALIEHAESVPVYGSLDDADFVLPRIEAAHVFRLNDNNLRIRPVVGYQSYTVEDAATGNDESIDSFLAGIGVSADINAAYVKGTASYMQNPGNYGYANVGNVSQLNILSTLSGGLVSNVDILDAQYVNGDVEDSTLMLGTLVGGFKANDMLTIEGGVSYMGAEVDLPAIPAVGAAYPGNAAGATAEQVAMLYYLQGNISMSDNVSFIPEIGMVDRGDLEVDGLDDIDQGAATYFNVTCRMDF